MNYIFNGMVSVLGMSLVAACIYRSVSQDKFGYPGFCLLAFGFLFGSLPFTRNLAVQLSATQGLNLKYEQLQKSQQELSGSLAQTAVELDREKETRQRLAAASRQTTRIGKDVADCMDAISREMTQRGSPWAGQLRDTIQRVRGSVSEMDALLAKVDAATKKE